MFWFVLEKDLLYWLPALCATGTAAGLGIAVGHLFFGRQPRRRRTLIIGVIAGLTSAWASMYLLPRVLFSVTFYRLGGEVVDLDYFAARVWWAADRHLPYWAIGMLVAFLAVLIMLGVARLRGAGTRQLEEPASSLGHWPRLSIRTLLIGQLILAGCLGGWLVYHRDALRRNQFYQRARDEWQPHGFRARTDEQGNVISLHPIRGEAASITDESLAALTRAPTLEQLHLDGTSITDHGLFLVAEMPGLKMLYLTSPNITDAGLVNLADAPKLEYLAIYNCDKISNAGLIHLADYACLADFSLSGSGITNDGVASLKTLSHLESLSLGCPNLTKDCLAHIAAIPGLKRLSLDGIPIDDASFGKLTALSNLEILTITGSTISDASAPNFQHFPNLKRLQLDSPRIGDECLVSLKNLQDLEVLSLFGATVTNAGVRHVSELRNLWSLSLNSPKITDEALVFVARLKKLRRLSLLGTSITDAGLVHLNDMPVLDDLDISGTRVTEKGRQRFAWANPHVTNIP